MFALIFVSILWAFSFGLIKGQLTGVDPSLVAAIRLLLCFLVFLPFFRWQKIPEKYSHYFILGMIQFGIMYWAYIQSYQFLPGYLVAVFTIFTPLYVMVFDALLQRRLMPKQLLVVMCSIMGAAVIVYKSPEQSDYLKGFLILQLANIVFALGQVGYRYLSKPSNQESHMTNMAIMYAGATTFSVVVVLLNGSYQGVSEITSQQWWVLIYLGVIASSFGFSLWNYGARQVSSAQLAIMNNGYIPVAVIFSLTLFGEQGDLKKLLLGGSIMVLSLWWSNKMTMK